jgi:hypothetical protein
MTADNDNSRNGSRGLSGLDRFPDSAAPFAVDDTSNGPRIREEPPTAVPVEFATRAGREDIGGVGKSKLLILGGGLAVAVLFFVFTALVGKSPKKPTNTKPPAQQTKQDATKPAKGSVTPVMETVRTPAPDNSGGQLGPNDIRRTRAANGQVLNKTNPSSSDSQASVKPAKASSLGGVPSFAETQQKWEEPTPYGDPPPATSARSQASQQNTLKEPSLIFVRREAQAPLTALRSNVGSEGVPVLEMAPGSRIQAKLQTQISSAVQAPVVAIVEYTYAIRDRVIVPAGARVYGQLQQADPSGLVSVKFDEIELLDGMREKIDAIGTGLDLGPIKGDVSGKNTGKNFLVRAAAGTGSVLAAIAGNNTNAAFSESDMLRERLAQNIGTAGDSEVMNLNAKTRVVVSVPADTKIYIVFTKHEGSSTELHRVASASP